jgi:hypothetical protein
MRQSFVDLLRFFERSRPLRGRRSQAHHPSVDGLEKRSLLSTVVVSAKANIFGAGLAAAPDPGGGGGGVLPLAVTLSTLGTPKVVDFPTATGTVSGWAAAGGYNGADGGSYWSGVTNTRPFGGISGSYDSHATMYMVGVFLGSSGQPKTAPATLNVSNANNVGSFSPVLGQQFFIGNGRTGTNALQTFTVPAGATKLYLGFSESWGFQYYGNYPGFYGDNGGAITVDVEGSKLPSLMSTSAPTSAPTTQAAGSDVNIAAINPSTALTTGRSSAATNSAVSNPSSSSFAQPKMAPRLPNGTILVDRSKGLVGTDHPLG